jgi:hypothetical protein
MLPLKIRLLDQFCDRLWLNYILLELLYWIKQKILLHYKQHPKEQRTNHFAGGE